MSKDKQTISNGIIIGIIVTVVGGVILAIITQSLDNIWSFIIIISGIVRKYLASAILVPVWVFWIFVLSYSYIIVRKLIRLLRNKSEDITYRLYRTDTIFGVKWSWDYYGQKIDDESIHGFCPTCLTRLIIKEEYYYGGPHDSFFCVRCNKSLIDSKEGKQQILLKVILEIERKLNTGEWLEVLQKQAREKNQNRERNLPKS